MFNLSVCITSYLKKKKRLPGPVLTKVLRRNFRKEWKSLKQSIHDWRNGKFASHKEAYHQLYKAVDKKDDAISKRYDRLGGSRYLETVAAILHDGYVSEE